LNEEKLRGLMGLCTRARQAVFGEEGCLKEIRSGKCGVLLLDGEISPAAERKYRGACAEAEVTVGKLPPGLLERATGRPGMAMAVRKGSFAEQMEKMLQS